MLPDRILSELNHKIYSYKLTSFSYENVSINSVPSRYIFKKCDYVLCTIKKSWQIIMNTLIKNMFGLNFRQTFNIMLWIWTHILRAFLFYLSESININSGTGKYLNRSL